MELNKIVCFLFLYLSVEWVAAEMCVCVATSTASSALNVRASAATWSTILGQVYKDECLVVTGSCGGSWCQVEFRGNTAYVSYSYVTGPQTCVQQTAQQRAVCSVHGDIMLLSPTGASLATAASDSLSVVGVAASNALVATDEARLQAYKTCFDSVGAAYGVHPALIAAIASRESRGGNALDGNGYGDGGNGYGLMQCDIHTSGLTCTAHGPYSCGHIDQLVKDRLVVDINALAALSRLSSWTQVQRLQGAVAAYNFGVSNVWTWSGLDGGSTNDDYSNDVMARAQYLVRRFGWTCGASQPDCVCVSLSTPSSTLNVRSGATTSSQIVGTANHGDCLVSKQPCGSGWCQVDFNSQTAYVSSNYVTGPQPCPAPTTAATTTSVPPVSCVCKAGGAGNLNVRSGSSTSSNIVGQAGSNECMESTGPCSGGWCPVMFNSNPAYVSESYVSGPQVCGHSRTSTCFGNYCGSSPPIGRACDSQGCGYFGAPRGSRDHNGNDVRCSTDQPIYAPFSGYVSRQVRPYGDGRCCDNGFDFVSNDPDWPDYRLRVFYSDGYTVNAVKSAGSQIATHIGLHCGCYGSSMTDHSHVELYVNDVRIDPTSFLYCNYL